MHSLGLCTLRPPSHVRPNRRVPGAPCAAVVAAAACLLCAQTPSAAPAPSATAASTAASPVFDVAAIHAHHPEPHERSHIVDSNGRFTTVNVNLKAIIQWAYDLPESRIVGAPSWLGSDRWDIEAKAENSIDMQKSYDPSAARLEKRRMVQALLADRFSLAAHTETRELPIYTLVVAKSGARFLATQARGTTIDRNNSSLRVEGGDNTVSLLAEQLAETLGRVVVDQTGITGRYNLALTWTPDLSAGQPSAASAPDQGPSLFTALEEQLGLKLEPRKGPVPVLVIDRVAMPTEN
jgi:uncharacterized protein (TIGR03435 family)